MDLTPVKQWIHRKRNRQFKKVTRVYAEKLKQVVAEETRERADEIKLTSILIQIKDDDEREKLYGITIDRSSLPDAKLGHDILLRQHSQQVVATGSIIYLDSDLIKIKFHKKFHYKSEIINEQRLFTLKFDGHSIVDRERKINRSLSKFNTFTRSLEIQKCLLGYYSDWTNEKHSKARVVGFDGLQGPRGSDQTLAITRSLKNRISLIEGVAGSGKTLMAANLACSSSKLRKCRVLLCSPIQATVDKLAELISRAEGVKVVQIRDGFFKQDRRRVLDKKKSKSTYVNKMIATEADYTLDKMIDEAIYAIGWNNYRRVLKPIKVPDAKLDIQAKRLVQMRSPWLRSKVSRQILDEADVVCCTLDQAGSADLTAIKFGMLIIDDAQVAKEADCMIPMMLKGIKQVTLLSDMRRDIRLSRSISPSSLDNREILLSEEELSSNSWSKTNSSTSETASMRVKKVNSVRSKPEANSKARIRTKEMQMRQVISLTGYPCEGNRNMNKLLSQKEKQKKQSRGHYINVESNFLEPGGLFERLLSMGLAAVALKYQFRMHKTLAAFANHHFYMSRLETDREANNQLAKRIRNDLLANPTNFNWLPKRDCLTAIFDTRGTGKLINETAANLANKLMIDENVARQKIGILINIKPISNSYLGFGDIVPEMVDNFVGQERDFIILACHNSNQNNDSDFLKDNIDLQVALTRARLGLFIVADLSNVIDETEDKNGDSLPMSSLTQNQTNDYCKSWQKLVQYYKKNQLVA